MNRLADVHEVLTFASQQPWGAQSQRGTLAGGAIAAAPSAFNEARTGDASSSITSDAGGLSMAHSVDVNHYDARKGQSEPKFVFKTDADAFDMRVGTRVRRRAST